MKTQPCNIYPYQTYFNGLGRMSENQSIYYGNYFVDLWLRSVDEKGSVIWAQFQPDTLHHVCMVEMAWW